MAVITLASITGAPGVTATAVGLAVSWPREVLLVDADREPAQAVAAGYLQGVELGGRGLGSLARAHRDRRPMAEELPLHWVDVDAAGDHPRHFLPGFTHPGAPGLFGSVWPDLATALTGLGSVGTDVIVDAGRVGRDGLPASLVQHSDLLLVCVRSNLRALAALRINLGQIQAQVEAVGASGEFGLLVVGAGRPYGVREIETQFGIPVLAHVAWEPRQAEVFSDGAPPPRSLVSSTLVRSLRSSASALTERIVRRDQVVAGERSVDDWSSR